MTSGKSTHNYYNELEIDSLATHSEIKEAYKKLARQFHPDINPSEDAKIRFSNIQKAYDILSDPKNRAEYDSSRGFLKEQEKIGFLKDTKILRQEKIYSNAEEETVYYINKKKPNTAKVEESITDRLKALIPNNLFNSGLIGRTFKSKTNNSTTPVERERIYQFTVNELEATKGTFRTLVLNYKGNQLKREINIPPIEKSGTILSISIPKPDGAVGTYPIKIKVNITPSA